MGKTLTSIDDFERKGIFGAHNCFGHFLDLGGFQKIKLGITVNFGKF